MTNFKKSIVLKIKEAFILSNFIIPLVFLSLGLSAQNTVYTPLYNSSNFIKTVDFTKPVGEIGGSASVTSTGGVTYSIPIYVCPGTNGLEPSISMTYNSQAANGIAGYGWNISGLSVITRAGKNNYHNGIVAPVNYSGTDAFLLDGMRLNSISGNNGANGTIYAGEAENFSKIVSFATGNSDDPDWFEVTTKDGSKMEFGNSDDSKLYSNTSSSVQNRILWRLNKLIDISGNYIEFKYDNSGRDSRLIQILYTGNSSTGLIPYNQINFSYSLRSDQNSMYESGSYLSSFYLLDKISILHVNDASITETVKTYKLNYGFDNVTSMLKEVVEFGGDENASSLNSTIFLYGEAGQNVVASTTEALMGGHDYYAGDFDADGRTDLVAAESHFNQNLGTFVHNNYSLIKEMDQYSSTLMYSKDLPVGTIVENVYNGEFFNFLTGDYNGDGRDDVLELSIAHGYGVNALFNGLSTLRINYTGSFNPTTGLYNYSTTNFIPPASNYGIHNIIHHVGAHFFIPGDFDGDGNQDYVLILGTVYTTINPYAFHYSYKAFYTSPSKNIVNREISNFGIGAVGDPLLYAETVTDADMVNVIDMDGDGKMEIFVTKGNNSYILSINPTSDIYVPYTTEVKYSIANMIVIDNKYFPADFNGDKKTDFLVRSNDGTWRVYYSNGRSYFSRPFSFSQTVAFNNGEITDKILVSDFNGDGKSDIMHGYNTGLYSSKLSMYYGVGVNGSSPAYNGFWYEQYDYAHKLGSVLVLGDFNGDGRSDFINKNDIFGDVEFVSVRPFSQERLLKKITTGHNLTTSIDYKLLTDQTYPYFYERTTSLDGPENSNPFNYVQLPMYAVSSFTIPDGVGGDNTTEYSYKDAVIHRYAKGFLGFKIIKSKNNISGITSITENEINKQFAVSYTMRNLTYLTSTNQGLSESLITNSFQDLSSGSQDIRYLQKVDKTLNIDYLNSDRATESTNTYDNYGNITERTSKTGYYSNTNTVVPLETVVSSSTFSIHNTPVPSKPDFITITKTRAGLPAVSTTTSYSYYSNGLVSSETSFSGLPKQVTTSYTYNDFGNPLTATTSATGISSRIAISTFDVKGRFALSLQKAGTGLVQTEYYTFSSKWGKPLAKTSTDCLVTSNEYDAFGNLVHTILPDGNNIYKTNNWQTTDISGAVNPNKLFYTYTHADGGSPDSKVYINKFGQEWRSETVSMYGPTARWHTVSTTYDNRGNIKTKTNPHFPSIPASPPPPPSYQQPIESPRITTYNYDIHNRVTSIVNDLGTISYLYSLVGNGTVKATVTNPAGQTNSQLTDATGKVIASVDNGGQLDFTFDSWGNQLEVKRGATILLYSTYDQYGKQTNLNDISAGTTTYDYDAFGQLILESGPQGNQNMSYDEFGRITAHTGPEGTTTYEYYSDASTGCNNNNLSKVTGFNGVTKEYSYDVLKRLSRETETLDGIAYTTTYRYNSFSQLSKTGYPSGVAIYKNYDSYGYLVNVYHTSTHPKNYLFKDGWVDGEGKYLTYGLGFGQTTNNTYYKGFPATTITSGIQNITYNFDIQTGNLLQRTDNLKNQSEYFGFDNLNRLTASTPNGIQQSGITYDATGPVTVGNIVAKTDAGYYKYKNDKINTLAYIMNIPVPGQQPVIPIPNTEISTAQQEISYTPFKKVASIGEGSINGGPLIDFTYGPDYERVKSELYQGHLGLTETKYYLGDYEIQIKNGVRRDIHYVNGGNGLCAILVLEAGTLSSYIVYTDHLGSITNVTDNNGANIIAEQNFDAWGRNRNPNNWNVYEPNPSLPDWLYRGFTGHEMMTQFGLINMNGRMYDPIIGRMISPDNLIPAPMSTQGYNRYTYAYNNPLNFIDPDGNDPITLTGAIIIGAMVGAFTGAVSADLAGKSAIGGFLKGALVGGVSGLFGAVGGGTFLANVVWGATQGVAVNGLSNTLDGDPFFQGAGTAALVGGAFAALSSGIESYKNWKEGYGFGTNDGVFNRLVDNSILDGKFVHASKAQRALDFWTKRFGGGKLLYDYTLSSSETKVWGTINISKPDFIDGAKNLRRVIAHESLGHYVHNLNWDNGKVGGKITTLKVINQGSQYGRDGVYGYNAAIKNWGRFHVGYNAITDKLLHAVYVRDAWNNFGFSKWLYGLPGRNFLFGIRFY